MAKTAKNVENVKNIVKLPPYLHKKLKVEAAMRGISLHNLMVKLITQGLDKKWY